MRALAAVLLIAAFAATASAKLPPPPTYLDSFSAGPGAYALARAGDAMWVTSFAGADVRKFVP